MIDILEALETDAKGLKVSVNLKIKKRLAIEYTYLTDLFLGLGFLDIVSSHFNPWGQDSSGELHHIHSQQMTKFLSS